ncbi:MULTISPECIES: transporter substrate-binding domain-containing protein [Aminobacterium]|jgi:polar amino acid transport system substrate-binding protein|uniref:transporter substrate-binding domain-containing protein n=1 Tax=Aminobacterium TaxID=81466 RepID=UPI000AFDE1BA|nr:transporter substrate-binding domain-containing protein [Aminobacterium sp. EBM-42]MDD2378954.1 transporter substrate-binding domain-containing protein [Aminobacterium colombiense]MDD3767487.1 transporter substrate-binding domain-containing protein [Aminobacterium colombiense]MDD4265601.1 transporter substrate-binding domain-containing protein [Aminobacterium colombiense]MDD4586571.1 transporter substrate-binding domain-containing protein [Aminobacterium colombiense]
MKKIGILLLCCIFVVLGASNVLAADKKTYIVGIDGDYYPYSFIGQDGKPAGFDVESIQWIAKEMGFEVKVQPMAWDGIIPALLAKKIDMVYSGMTASPERREVVTFSKVYWIINQAVCVRNNTDTNMGNLFDGKHTIGTQRGCTAAMWLEDYVVKTGIIPSQNLKLYDNFPLAAKDLENGRIDAAMMDDVIVAKAVEGKDMKIIGTISTGEEYAVAMRKEDKELHDLINEGLDRLMTSPMWNELKLKYKMF